MAFKLEQIQIYRFSFTLLVMYDFLKFVIKFLYVEIIKAIIVS